MQKAKERDREGEMRNGGKEGRREGGGPKMRMGPGFRITGEPTEKRWKKACSGVAQDLHRTYLTKKGFKNKLQYGFLLCFKSWNKNFDLSNKTLKVCGVLYS